jgi:hypothetical protein
VRAIRERTRRATFKFLFQTNRRATRLIVSSSSSSQAPRETAEPRTRRASRKSTTARSETRTGSRRTATTWTR